MKWLLRFARWRRWRRARPGLLHAAMLAEVEAYSHKNANLMGPEQNLLSLSQQLYALYRGDGAMALSISNQRKGKE